MTVSRSPSQLELDLPGSRPAAKPRVRAKRPASEVMESLTRFIERRLKLQVNAEKSAVAQPWRRSSLGFTAA